MSTTAVHDELDVGRRALRSAIGDKHGLRGLESCGLALASATTFEQLARIAKEYGVPFRLTAGEPQAVPARQPEPAAEPEPRAAAPPRYNADRRARGQPPAHRVPEWRRIDHEGAAWRPRRRGNQNADVRGDFRMVPTYVNATIRLAMPRAVFLAYYACCDEADLDGQFQMPAGRLAELICCATRNARAALAALVAARLLRVIHQGGRRQANVYGLTPWREFDQERTLKALEAHRAEVTQRLTKVAGDA